jgi:hypothetical protein
MYFTVAEEKHGEVTSGRALREERGVGGGGDRTWALSCRGEGINVAPGGCVRHVRTR